MRTPLPTHRTPTRRFVLRPISLAVCLLGAAPASFGLPQDGVPSFGQTTVRQTAPNQLDITQGTQRAGIDWRSFSIGANERVVVTQPGRDSVLLNRVLGNDPSQIFGNLQSNGSVWLINPRGIVFGANARVDVGSLLASTLSITNEDIASGRLVLGRGAGTPGELVNEGQITAPGGSVILVAPQLTHSGRIDARRVGLAAATEVTVDVEGDGLIFFNVRNDGSLATRLSLLGNVLADGGLAEVRAAARAGFADTVLNLDGIVQARSIGQREGRIVIDGGRDGVTLIGGRVDATGGAAGEHGGEITVLGQKIGVASSATLDASGAAGGGTLLVGGDFQGKNAALHNAEMVSVLSGARLDVSATQLGDGGKLIVWSDQVTRFAGAADARGGAHGGDGGFVEVSGKQHLDFTGSSDRSAPQGRAGMLLLDPKSLLIQDSGADINGSAGGPSVDIVDGDLTGAGVFRFNDFNAANPSIITKAGIAALTGGAGGAVTLQAEDSITVAAGAALTRTGALTLQAGANIVINANITSTGDLTLLANNSGGAQTGSGRVDLASGVALNSSGTVTISNDGGGATGVHQIGGNITAASLAFVGDVNLTGNSTWTLSGSSSIASVIIGGAGAGLEKAGVGTLVLSGANLYAGTTTLSGGTLNIGAGGTTGTLGTGAVTNNATLAFNRSDDLSVANAIGGTGNLTKAGAGKLTLTGANTYDGSTGITAGVLEVGAGGTTGTLGDGAVTVGIGTTLRINRSDTLTIANAIGGDGGLVQAGAGIADLTAANTYLGGSSVSAGTLRVRGAAATAGDVTGAIALAAGTTLDIAGGASVANDVTLAGSASITSSSGGGTLAAGTALSAPAASTLTLSGGSGSLAVVRDIDQGGATAEVAVSGGTVILSSAGSDYAGGTAVSGGATLRVSGSGIAGVGAITLASGATLDLVNAIVANAITSNGGAISNSSGTATLSAANALTLGDATTTTLSGAGSGLTVARAIDDGAGTGAVTVAGGSVTFSADNSYGGITTLSGGTLNIGAGGTTGTLGTGAVTNNATLAFNRSDDLSVANAIGGTGNLTKAGAGKLTLTGANTYDGSTGITAGVLEVGAGGTTGTLGDGAVTVGTGTTLRINRSDTLTIANAIGGDGGLVQAGAGIADLTAANTYLGGSSVSAGTLRVRGAAATAGDVTGAIALAAGTTLDIAGGASVANDVTLAGSASITSSSGGGTLAAGTALSAPAASTLTLSGGSGSLAVVRDIDQGGATAAVAVSGGTVILSSAGSDYAGGTAVSGGATLRVSGSGIAGVGAITLASGATLDLVNAIVANAITSNGGAISNSSGTATLSAANALTLGDATTTTLSGAGSGLTVARAIDDGAGTGAVTVAGGSVTFSADNSYGGITTLSGGTLNIGAGGTTGTLGTGAVTNNATMAFNRSDDLSVANAIGGTGNLTKAGTGKLTLTGANTYDGSTGITAGVLEVGAGGTTGTLGTGAVTNNATLAFNRSDDLSVANAIGGTGNLTKAGAGKLTLTGANTYDGSTGITAGVLEVGAGGTTGTLGDGAVTVGTGTTLRINRSDTLTIANAIGGDGGLVQAGAGIADLTAANTYLGGSSVSAGTLRVRGAAATAGDVTGAIALAAGTTLDIAGGASVANDVTLAGSASITSSSGGGTLAAGTALSAPAASTLTLSGGSGSLAVVRDIDQGGATAAVAVSGGTVILSSAGSDYAGGTAVSGGATLRVSGSGIAGVGAITLASGATLDLVNAIVANAITSNGGAISNSSGTATLSAANALTLGDATTTTLSGAGSGLTVARVITDGAGTAAVTVSGGSVTFAADNSYGGITALSGGTLNIGAGGTTGTLGAGAVTNNATLAFNRSDDLSVANAIGGTGNLTKAGAGKLTLTGANTYDGSTGITAGVLEVGAGGTTGTLGDGAVTVGTGTTLRINRSDTLTIANAIGGDGGLVQAGAGIADLTAANTYLGGSSVSAGTLRVRGAAATAGDVTGAIALAAGTTLDIAGGASVANDVTLAGSASITSSSGGGTLAAGTALSAPAASTLTLSGGSGSLAVVRDIDQGGATAAVAVSGGTVILSSAGSDYAGGTAVSGGATLRVSGSGIAGVGAITLASGATLDLVNASVANAITSNGGAISNSSGTATLSAANALTLGDATTTTLSGAGSGLTVARVITDGAGTAAVTVSGGSVTFAADNSYGGITALSGGTLNIGAGGTTGTLGAGAVTNNAILAFNRSNDLTVANAIGGTGNLTKAGAGKLTLTGANTYDGSTGITAGVLEVGAGGTTGTLGDGAVTVGTGTTLRINRSDTLTIANAIGGDGGLAQAGSGTTELTAVNTYLGDTSVDAGILRLLGAGTAGASSGTIALGSRTLDIAGGASVANEVTIANGGTITNSSGIGTLAAGPALVLPAASSITLSSSGTELRVQRTIDASAGGSGVVFGGGTVTLGSGSSYDGAVSVAGGATLRLAGSATLGAAAINLASGGTLDIVDGAAVGVAVASSGGSITNTSGSGTLNGALTLLADSAVASTATGLTLAGSIGDGAGTFGLNKSGSGSVTLTAANTYDGLTTLNAGTLNIGGGGSTGTLGTGAVTNNATLRFNRGDNLTLVNAIGGSGNVTQAGSGTLTFGGANTYTGATAVDAGTLVAANALALGTAAGGTTVASGATLELNGVDIGTEALNLTGTGVAGAGALVGTGTASAGGAVTLAGNTRIGGSGNLNLGGVVGESGGARSLTKVGSSTLTLSGANTYAGATAVDVGTLVATNALALGTAAGGTGVASGATLQLNGVDIGTEALSLAGSGVGGIGALVASGATAVGGAVTLAGNSTLSSSGALTLGGAVGESGGARALTKIGSGTLTLSGANSYSGATAIDGGTLVAGNALALGTAAGGTSVGSGATLELNSINIGTEALNLAGAGVAGGGALVGTGTAVAGGAVTLAGDTSIGSTGTLTLGGIIGESGGARALTKIGSGTLTLSGANTYTGATAVNTGTLVAANALALGGTAQGTAVSSGATLAIDNASIGNEALSLAGSGVAGAGALLGTNTASTGGAVTLTADTVIGGTGALTLSGSIGESGGARSLTKIGSGSLTLAGANSYTGSTAVNVGTLVASNALALGTTAAGTTVASAATLEVNNVDIGIEALQLAGSGAGGAGALAGSGAGAAAGGTITLAADTAIGGTGALTLGGAIGESGGARALNKVGSGTLTLAGNNTYTGGTNLAAGTLRAQGGAAIPDASALTLTAGANFTLLTSETIGSLAAAGASTAVLALGTNTLTTGGNGNSTSFDGVISGAAGSQLVKTGAGTFTLAGANTYVGTTTVNAGTLALGAAGRLADASTLAVSGGVFDLGGFADSVAGVQQTGGSIVNGTLTSTSTFDMQAGSASAVLAGSVGLNKTTTGTVTLSGANTYTGTTAVSAGTLALGASNSLADASALVVNGATATLDIGIHSDTVASVLLQGGGTLTGSNGVLGSTAAFDLQSGTVSAILGGNAGLNKSTAGSVTLSAANTYTGATTVSAGTLLLGAAERLADTSTLVVSGGSFDLGGYIETVAGVQQTGGSIVNGTLTSTSAFDMQAGSASAVLAGSTGLNKTGGGTFTLSGANTYTGITTVSAGTLLLGAANVLADASTLRVSGGVFNLGGVSETVAGVQQTGGSIVNGTLTSTSGFDLQAGITSAGLVSSTGLNKTGAGTITLTGSYSGAITVSAGTLALGADNLIADGSPVTINGATATLDIGSHSDTVASVSLLSGSITGTSGVLTSIAAFDLQSGTVDAILGGGAGLNKTGAGTVTLNAANTYTGATTVSAGTLALGAADRLTNTSALVVNGGSFDLGGFSQAVPGVRQTGGSIVNGTLTSNSSFDMQAGSASAVLAGSTGLNKTGGGLFTLSGANTYTGATTVSAGTLLLGASERLANNGTLVVNGGAFDLGGFAETVAGVRQTGGNIVNGTLTSTSTFDMQAGAASATLAGTVGLDKTTGGTFTLSGANAYTGITTVSDGRLALGAGNSLADASALVVNGATATLDIATHSDTVASVLLQGGGTLTGSTGVLSSTSAFDLQSGTVSAILGGNAGLNKTSTGSVTLSAANTYTGATTVSAGTLLLGASERLADASTLVVSGGVFNLGGFAEAVAGVRQTGGSIVNGTLTSTSAFDMQAGSASAVLAGTAGLNKAGAGTYTLSAANTYTGTTQVDAGTLVLGAADRLADASTITVASGAVLALGGDETVASLLLRGLLGGSGTLTAAGVTLDSGTANANLSTPSLVSLGSSTLAGTAAAGTVGVQTGTLTLAAADRLADGAAVTVASNATLALVGNDTVATLLLQGRLTGSSRLSATTTTLDGGTAVADLGTGALVSTGASTLAGGSLADTVLVSGGTLALASAGRLLAAPAVSVNTGATLALNGNETIGSLANGIAGGGSVSLGAATLATGSGGDSSFAGAITGSGGLTKQGSSNFTLAGDNTYSGLTRVDAGTLTVGDGGSGGSIANTATNAFIVDGVLRSARADSVSFGQAISGSGAFEQVGGLSGNASSVTFQGGNKTYTGETRVLGGALATLGNEQLPDASDLRVAAGAALALGGSETLRSVNVNALGAVTLGGNLTTTGAMALTGAVRVGGLAVTLKGQQIDADNAGNDWGSGAISIDAGAAVTLDSGSNAVERRNLVLGSVNAAAGGTVSAGVISLQGDITVSGGTLSLVSSALAQPSAPDAALLGKISPAQRQIAFAGDVVTQATGTRIDVAETAGLQVIAENGGSVQLLGRALGNDPTLAPLNSFRGSLEVLTSKKPVSPWAGNPVSANFGGGTQDYSMQSHVQIGGTTVRVGGAGIEADIVAIRADKLSSAAGAVITARMPFDNLAGTTNALPALTLELTDAAFLTSFPFGQNGGNEIAINVGSRAWGNRSSPIIDSGYITVLPRNGARGATAVVLSGPGVGGYTFFFDGAGVQSEIPVFYNGVLPVTPQVSGSISATVAVSEGARKERFDEAVRTENVAVRLRSGVIAEVGPGRPATVGTEGARAPAGCTPMAATLACEAP